VASFDPRALGQQTENRCFDVLVAAGIALALLGSFVEEYVKKTIASVGNT